MEITERIMRAARAAVLFGIMALAAACSNDEETAGATGGVGSKDVTLTATFPTTRVGFDGSGSGYWHKDDSIGVWSASENKYVKFTLSDGAGEATATFTGSITDEITGETAVLYPYNEEHTDTMYCLPNEYTYTGVDEDYYNADGTAGINSFRMPMRGTVTVGSDGAKTVSFKHIGSVIAIKIDKIPAASGCMHVFSTNRGISGGAPIGTDKLSTPPVAMSDRNVLFYYSNATVGQPGVFYLPVAPDTPYGIEVTIYDESWGELYHTYCQYVTMECGHIKKFVVSTADNSKEIGGHRFVDLGLPSGLLWAETNLGATAATDCGKYYAWGETTAYGETTDWNGGFVKTVYDWANYKFGTESELTKYTSTDGLTTLENDDDAAYKNWGSYCQMPTIENFRELTGYCTWTWDDTNNGFILTSGINKNTIFLPASGLYVDSIYSDGGGGCGFWSSSLKDGDTKNAMFMALYGSNRTLGFLDRKLGMTIRPVAKP